MNAHAHPLVIEPATPDTFTYDQLSDDAKAHARERYLESDPYDYDWWDQVYEDADQIAEMMGIDIDRRTEKRHDGTLAVTGPDIMFSGFSCQGDGACFTGDWRPVNAPGAMVRKVRAHAPKDRDLHRLALVLAKTSRDAKAFESVRTRITHSDRYYHAYSADIDTEIEMPEDYEDWHEVKQAAFDAITKGAADRIEHDVKEALRAFMNWIYAQLDAEWDAMHEDDYVDEHLSNQDTLFDEDGDEI